jgi:hypothetical protein
VITYAKARVTFARAIYDLLLNSDEREWFSVAEITKKSGLDIGTAFVSRILDISRDDGEIFESDSDNYWTLTGDGFSLVETEMLYDQVPDDQAPASDRVVRFNHNAPEAQEIATLIDDICESVRGANGAEINELERERVSAALGVAKAVWQSGSFKLIQLKVGVLMAAEDAAALLISNAKHVAAAMLVDAIKAFAKNHFHADLDGI